jgi:hypothetical protein
MTGVFRGPGTGKNVCAEVITVVLLIAIPACGTNNPVGRRALSGRVTTNGVPLASGYIHFVPSKSAGTASGAMIVEGKYSLNTSHGLRPGMYIVQICSPHPSASARTRNAPPSGAYQRGVEQIPSQYNSASLLAVEVTASGSTNFDFDLRQQADRQLRAP